MNETDVSATQLSPAADPAWNDWVTIWQSEMAALAVDREAHEAMQRAADLWAAAVLAAGSLDAGGPTRPAAPPGSSAVAAASDGPPGNRDGEAR